MNKESIVKPSIITNMVLTIDTNLSICPKKVVAHFGGNYTAEQLPGARRIVRISDTRYTLLIYSTGKILLPNFHFRNDLKTLFSWISSFIYKLVHFNIAKTKNNHSKIKVKLLVENLVFACYIDFVNSIQLNKLIHENIMSNQNSFNIQRNSALQPHIILEFTNNLKTLSNFKSIVYKDLTRNSFPGRIFQLEFNRGNNDSNSLSSYKSEASKKRRHFSKFDIQKVSLTIFTNGKILISGCQIKEDVNNILNMILLLVSIFLK
jgi:TATA-box binding protein (TBP) (component of TFIID and TFIIIB)